jgi:tetratricopeptide (TPR) repeat protein
MASVFLSYAREDSAQARPIALALEKHGHSVWWDLHVRGGAQFAKVIEEALKAADAVVVLWSKHSIESAWVLDEAAAGRDTGRLVPITIDGTEPPLGFRQFQTIDLSRWKGRARSPEMQEALAAVAGLGKQSTAVAAPVAQSGRRGRLPAPALVTALVAAVLAASLFVWRPWAAESTTPVVAVAAAAASPSAQASARDLLAKLGDLRAAKTDRLQLVGHQSAGTADLIFEVDSSVHGSRSEAGLVLLDGKDRSLLWSNDFAQPTARRGDLEQQVAYTAARVLDCALEALGTRGKALDQQVLKIYLNGCAAHAEITGADPTELLPVFRQVTESVPDFEGGWAKLLDVETEMALYVFHPDYDAVRKRLRDDIVRARKLNPDMAEAFLAEASLLPQNAFLDRMRLIRHALRSEPDNGSALRAHSTNLQTVGRMKDSVEEAWRAVQLDPLSPAQRDALISALTYAGELDAALEEISKAEQLWPGATNLMNARYRLHLRYGDPREALRIDRTGVIANSGGRYLASFLRARIDPSDKNIGQAIAENRILFGQHPEAVAHLSQTLATFGRAEELFPILLNWDRPDRVGFVVDVLFRPAFRNVHRDPRMIAIAKRIGLLDYWRKSGEWPDFCFEPDLPYDCKKEAARLLA